MADVSVSLDLDAQQLFNELQQVQTHFAQFASKATAEGEKASHGFSSGFKSGLGGLGENLVQGIAALGIGSKVNELVEYGAKIQDLHERYGVATDALQRFGNAAEKNGSSLEAVAKGFRFLEVNQAKALGGNEGMVKAFQSLGVSFTELQSLRPEDLMAKIGESSLNAADVVKVLGRSAIELRPTLAGIADGTVKLGGAISAINIKKLKDVDDQLKGIHQTLTIVGGGAIANFVKNFQNSIGQLVLNSTAGIEEIKGVFGAIVDVAKANFDALGTLFGGLGKAMKEALHGHFSEAGNSIKEAVTNTGVEVNAGLEKAEKDFKAHHQTAKDLHDEANKFGSEPDEAKKKRDLGAAPEGDEAAGKFDDQGRPIRKTDEERDADKEAKSEERDKEREQKEQAKEATAAAQEQQKTQNKLNKIDEDNAKNPTGVSLHDYASQGAGHVQAVAQETEREEKLARQRQLVGDFKGATQHQDRAEHLKKSLGLPSKEDAKDNIKKGLDESEVLKAIKKNTEGAGANK